MIAIDLSKQQALDAHPKAIREINFTGQFDRNATTFCYLRSERNFSRFSTRTCECIVNAIVRKIVQFTI